jgi:hypothetical protein
VANLCTICIYDPPSCCAAAEQFHQVNVISRSNSKLLNYTEAAVCDAFAYAETASFVLDSDLPERFCVLSEMRGAYFDPNTNIRYDTNGADFEGKACLGRRLNKLGSDIQVSLAGWLTKQSSWLKDWRRRYFILKGSKLFFSKVCWGCHPGAAHLHNI